MAVAGLELFHELYHVGFDLACKILLLLLICDFVVELDDLVGGVGEGNKSNRV